MSQDKPQEFILPPFRQPYQLSTNAQSILDRFKEELEHRIKLSVTFEIFTENLLAYPSLYQDFVQFKITIGNYRRVHSVHEFEINSAVGGSFFYFCRKLVDDAMADLITIGASRA